MNIIETTNDIDGKCKYINNNLFILQENSQNAKNITKRLIEENLMTSFTFKKCDNVDSYLSIFKEYLLKIKPNLSKENEFIGFLSDRNILNTYVENDKGNKKISTLESVPENCDVLFLQYIANKFYYNKDMSRDTNKNWTRVDVLDSYHFAINSKCIDKILEISNKSNSWNEFIKNLNILQCYGITQEQYSYMDTSTLNVKYNNINELQNITKVGNLFDLKCKKLTETQKYKMYPNISLLCILTDIDRFIHILHSFLKLDYPKNKLELVVVDDKKTELDKKFQSLIPNDSRISFINLNPENVEDNYKLPLGYKINTGVKYSKYDVIFHLFDTNVYYIDNFSNLIKTFIMCNKDILLSQDTGLYVQNKAAANYCWYDVNDVALYENYYKCLCQNGIVKNPKGYKMVIQQSIAPYTKTIYQPKDCSDYTLRIQQQCQNPKPWQKPFPFAVSNGTGQSAAGTSITSFANSCGSSNRVYLTPPKWYIEK